MDSENKKWNKNINGWTLLFLIINVLNTFNYSRAVTINGSNTSQDAWVIINWITILLFSFIIDRLVQSLLIALSSLIFFIHELVTLTSIHYQVFVLHALAIIFSLIARYLTNKSRLTINAEKLPEKSMNVNTHNKVTKARDLHHFLVILFTSPIPVVIFLLQPLFNVSFFPTTSALLLHVFIYPLGFILLYFVFFRLFPRKKEIYNVFLTHHDIEQSNHTIKLTIGNFSLFLCTRCSGMIAGLALSSYFFLTFNIYISPFNALILDIFIPLPVFIDWGTQKFGFRTSNTFSRILTGGLTGLGFQLLSISMKEYMIWSGLLLIIYFSILFFLSFISFDRSFSFDDENVDDDIVPKEPSSA
ncbi:MAG: DUF2085 domain-containing protein [Promethearchaeota archaeon]